MRVDSHRDIRLSAVIVLLLLSAFVMGYGGYRARMVGLRSVRAMAPLGWPPESEPRSIEFGRQSLPYLIKLDYGQWTKGNGATLSIKDSTSSPSLVFRIEVIDDESSSRNAYLVMANLDSDPDLEFFVHQPNIPRAIHRASSISADGTPNMLPGTFIVDFVEGQFRKYPLGKWRAFWLTGFARWEFQMYLGLLLCVLLCLKKNRPLGNDSKSAEQETAQRN